jgi:hypothetical protein
MPGRPSSTERLWREGFMNTLFLLLALMIFQPRTLVWAASYQIHLKNGNEIKTSHYWEEGDEIKFYTYGGVAGIQKGLVSKVTTSNLNYKQDSSSKEDSEKGRARSVLSGPESTESAQSRPGETASRADGSGEKKGSIGGAVDFDYYRERKAALKEKFDNAMQRNEEAKARQDQEATALTRNEYLKYSKQLFELGDDLKRKNKGILPDWWKD